MRDEYFKGKGLNIKLLPREIDNLYRPSARHRIESFDYLHVQNSLDKKFAPILLKEWFFLLKPSGFLAIDYVPTKGLTFQAVEEIFWWLFKGNYDIKIHKAGKRSSRIVVQKKKSMFISGDSIDKWSFGIVTNGKRDDWIEQIIQSIHAQNIPHYEIIVCGKYRDRKEKNFTYIDFNERADLGWITKKKNLIAEKAKYENLCVIHDRLVFDKGWYKGMKKYGNAFEILGCVQIEKNRGIRAGDWLTQGQPGEGGYKKASLIYTDWDFYTYLSGQLTIIKKSIWHKVLWNETRYWVTGDDVDTSFRARDLGYIIRFNPYSSMTALIWGHGNIPLKYYRSQGFFPKDMVVRRTMRFIASYLCKIPYATNLIDKIYTVFMKIPLSRRFLYS